MEYNLGTIRWGVGGGWVKKGEGITKYKLPVMKTVTGAYGAAPGVQSITLEQPCRCQVGTSLMGGSFHKLHECPTLLYH